MAIDHNSDELLTTAEAGKLLGVHATTVNYYVDRGQLKGYRTPGGHRRIRRSDVIAFLERRQKAARSSVSTDRIRLLVVDDDAAALNSIRRVLAVVPLEAAAYLTDPAEAIEMAPVLKPTLVVADVFMPEIGGFELAHRLRAISEARNADLVFITGFATPEMQKMAERMFGVIVEKPFEWHDIAAALHLEISEPTK